MRADQFPLTCVVDASVLVKLFVPEEGSEAATALLATAGVTRRVAVPDLAPVECANVLRTWVRRGRLTPDVARQSVGDLILLPLEVWPAEDLLPAAMHLALTQGITVYDALYVALADRLDCPLITADAALVRAIAATNPRVRPLDLNRP